MSEAYVHGFNLVARRRAAAAGHVDAQVDGAEACLVTSGEGVPTSALLLLKKA